MTFVEILRKKRLIKKSEWTDILRYVEIWRKKRLIKKREWIGIFRTRRLALSGGQHMEKL